MYACVYRVCVYACMYLYMYVIEYACMYINVCTYTIYKNPIMIMNDCVHGSSVDLSVS